jgi:anti-sigma factor RsiW
MKRCKYEVSAHLYPLSALSPGERKEFEAHMAACGECARIVKEASRISAMYKTMSVDSPAPGFEQRILNSIRSRSEARSAGFDWASFFRFNKAMLPVAACLTIFLFIAVLFTNPAGALKNVATTTAAIANQQRLAPSDYYIKDSFGKNEGTLISGDRGAAVKSYYKILGEKYKSEAKGVR